MNILYFYYLNTVDLCFLICHTFVAVVGTSREESEGLLQLQHACSLTVSLSVPSCIILCLFPGLQISPLPYRQNRAMLVSYHAVFMGTVTPDSEKSCALLPHPDLESYIHSCYYHSCSLCHWLSPQLLLAICYFLLARAQNFSSLSLLFTLLSLVPLHCYWNRFYRDSASFWCGYC